MQKNKLTLIIMIEFILIIILSSISIANPFENVQITDGFEVIGKELNNILTKNFALLAIVLITLALLFYSIVNTSLKKTPIGENKTISWSLAILMVGGLYYKSIPYGGMTAFLDNILGQTVALILIIFTVIVLSWLKGNKSMGTPLILASLLVITWYYNQDQAQYLVIAILIFLFVLLRRFNIFSQDSSKGSIYNKKPSTFKDRKNWFTRTKKTGKEIFDTLKKDLQTAEGKERFINDTYKKEKIHETINNYLENVSNKIKNEFNGLSIRLKYGEIELAKQKLTEIKQTLENAINKTKELPQELKEIKKGYKNWQTLDLDHQISKLNLLEIDNEKNKHLLEDLELINKISKRSKEITNELLKLDIQDNRIYEKITKRLEKIKTGTKKLLKILDSDDNHKTEEFKNEFKEVLHNIEKLKKPEELVKKNPIYEENLLRELYKINIKIKEILSKAEKEEKEDEMKIEKDFREF
jgi:hypothetical protein